MGVTIYDIARELGITHATVSRALRGERTIAAATQRRVRAAAKRMGYRPNLLARGLTQGRTQTVGLLIHGYVDEAPMTKLLTLDAAANDAGYRLFVTNTCGDAQRAIDAAKDLAARGVDGLLVYGLADEEAGRVADALQQLGLAVVFFDDAAPAGSQYVLLDRAAGMREAMSALAALGHRRIALLRAAWMTTSPYNRFHGFAKGAMELKLDEAPVFQVCGGGHVSPLELDAVPEGIDRFLREQPRCTAVICTNDDLGLSVMAALRSRGVRVPEDLSVVGFDDTLGARFANPALASVRQPAHDVARAAWATLAARMARDHDAPATASPQRFVCAFVARESIGPART